MMGAGGGVSVVAGGTSDEGSVGGALRMVAGDGGTGGGLAISSGAGVFDDGGGMAISAGNGASNAGGMTVISSGEGHRGGAVLLEAGKGETFLFGDIEKADAKVHPETSGE